VATTSIVRSLHAGHVVGAGVAFNGDATNTRKVLTTRDDGLIWIQLLPGGARVYPNLTHE